ncbi:hypothetical protein BHE90_016763 [Fusarium euwallaceae]|uniref:PD-(D/E)XK nuclease-like domain-containing protein n=2 Tax=Fusarium solani species complex TaxID=232080 RepID=A0A430KZH1_9HYPO|nr:hypothetical protein CEP51_016092 [Fusarium floridanum]RTE68858.1 hypothetical protein BHE90_016763 [Fusarium euwallaceae]
MHISSIESWLNQVVAPDPVQQAFARKRKASDARIVMGVSSPPQSIASAPDYDPDATPRAGESSKRRKAADGRKVNIGVPLDLRQVKATHDGTTSLPPSTTSSTTGSSTTGGSTTGGRSNKSKRRVKDMGDLELAEKPVRQVTHLKREEEYPQDVRALLKNVRDVRRGIGILPRPVADQARKLLNIVDEPLEADNNLYDKNIWAVPGLQDSLDWDVNFELKVLERVMERTETCITENVSEPSWNSRVHEPLLDMALEPFSRIVGHWDVTKAVIEKDYVLPSGPGIDLQSKMVDFCLTLSDNDVMQAAKMRLRPSNRRMINHTEYQALRFRPISISIETKTPDGSTQEARAQLSVWTTAYMARLRELAGTPTGALDITLPILTVRGGQWELSFIIDKADGIDMVTLPPIADTRSIVDCYKVVALIRWLAVWSATVFRKWIMDRALAQRST